MTDSQDDPTLGPFVRLSGIGLDQLPKDEPESVSRFISAVLQEAVPFIDSVNSPDGPWRHKSTKTFSGPATKVDLFERLVSARALTELELQPMSAKLAPETWACRRSMHQDAASAGTATWEDFVRHLRDEHVESEQAYTPTVVATNRPMRWGSSAMAEEEVQAGGRRWGSLDLSVAETRHRIGLPLRDRVFAFALITASAVDEFVVVSVPIRDMAASDAAVLSRSHGVVAGAYVSVERVRRTGDGHVEWIMATASNAGGVLPMWVQNKAVPGAIAKDVGLFLSWITRERLGSGDSRGET